MSILLQNWKKSHSICPTCKSPFPKEKGIKLYVQIKLSNGKFSNKAKYIYCSETCLNVKLDTAGTGLNPMERVKIISKEKKFGDYHVLCEPLVSFVKVE